MKGIDFQLHTPLIHTISGTPFLFVVYFFYRCKYFIVLEFMLRILSFALSGIHYAKFTHGIFVSSRQQTLNWWHKKKEKKLMWRSEVSLAWSSLLSLIYWRSRKELLIQGSSAVAVDLYLPSGGFTVPPAATTNLLPPGGLILAWW